MMNGLRRIPSLRWSRTLSLVSGGALALAATTLGLTMFSQAKPGDDRSGSGPARTEVAQADAPEDGGEAQPKRRRAPEPKPRPKAEPARAEPAKPEPPKVGAGKGEAPKGDAGKGDAGAGSLVGAAAAGASTSTTGYNISARLTQNGAGTCAGVIDSEAASSMVGVTESNTISQWSTVDPRDRHAASVFVGQRYGQNAAVPFGITGLIASPTPTGSCDITSIQVVSSPLPCARVRETLARTGKVLGEIAGMPVIGANEGQTMLMPTATNTCVLVAFRSKYGG